MSNEEEKGYHLGSLEEAREEMLANPKVTVEGLEAMRQAFEKWINEVIDRDGDLKYTTALMVAHNFYKLVVQDIADKAKMTEEDSRGFYAQSLLRLSQALLEPEKSRELERKRRESNDVPVNQEDW